MFTTADLVYMREQANLLMPDTGTILTETRSSDGIGGFTSTWGTAAITACRLDHKRGMKALSGGALVPFSENILTVPYNTSITTANRFAHGTETYIITNVDADKSCPVVLRCTVEAVP